jgi:DNA-binding SARP family transcriptional activator/WD40 repeat protein
VWFGTLGRLEVRRADGSPVSISGPARRLVLAALLCRAGSLVSASTLIDDVWGAAAPRSALGSLRSHVARLRDDLGRDEADRVLVTEGDGYRLNVEADEIDSATFERLVREASELVEPAGAIRRLDDALALWRDEAFVEFGEAPFAVGERIRLAELRAHARERRTDVALASGHAGELIAELEQRVRSEPYRERGWEQLAIALYRAGRQADALAACRRARQVLVDDLGVEPGPALQALEDRLLRQARDLLGVVAQPLPAGHLIDRCPYLGLAGYEEHDAALFVGRERLTAILAGRLADQSVAVVTGASGVGKSSLVRAGLVSALRSGALPGSAAWRIDVCTPSDEVLGGDPVRRPDVLVIDQAEQLFTSLDAEARDELIARLVDYVEVLNGRLIIVLRSDFYGRLAEVESLAPFAEKTATLVGPMRADELRRALVEPAAAAGLQLEPELIEAIMADVAGQPEPLPLLSEAMVRTWQRRHGDVLTVEGYRRAGELAGALEAAAEECYSRLDDAERGAARHVLVRMALRTGSGWVRRPITLVQTEPVDAAEQQALAALISARLVVASDERVEIAHDALFVHWPRLREWLDERSIAADLLQHLDQSATVWRSAGNQEADLYRGPRLSAATDWRAEHPEDVSSGEAEFLDASARAANAELEAAREQAIREARGRRNLRRVAIALTAMVGLALAGGAIALHERGTARSQAHRAEQASLSADARRLAALSANAPDIATSSLLAVAAYRLQDSPDTRGALLSAVERGQSALWRIPFQHRPQRVVATPDGSRLAVNDNRLQVTIVDPRTREQLRSFPSIGYIDGITSNGRQVVAFGPTNSAERVGRLAVYDVSSGHEQVLSDAGDMDVGDPVVTSDGRWVAISTTRRVGTGATVDVFDSRDWSAPPRHFVTAGPPAGLAAGRSALAVEGRDGSAEVRALPSLRVIARLPATSRPAPFGTTLLAVSPAGSHVARIDPADPRRALLYPLDGSSTATPLPLQPQGISALRFSPDGTELAVGSYSGSLVTYRTRGGAQIESLAGHAGPLLGLAWAGESAPTGLYSVGLDGQLVSWDLGRGPRTVREMGVAHLPAIRAERFGSLVIGDMQPSNTPNSRRRLFTIDVQTAAFASWPAGLRDDEGIDQIVSSSNGRRALVSITGMAGDHAGQNRVEEFDLRTHENVGHLLFPAGTGHFVDGVAAAISPDARYAYSSLSRSRIGVFALPSGRYLRSYTVRFSDPNSGRVAVIPWQFDPAGRLVLGGFDPGPNASEPWAKSGPPLAPDQRLGLMDVSSGRLLAQTRLGDVQAPSALAWSHDGRALAVGTLDGTLALYDAATFTQRTTAGTVSSGFVTTAAFAPDDRTVVLGGTDGAVNFFSYPDLAREGQRIVIANSANNGGVWAWYAPNGDVVGLAQDDRRSDTDDQRWFAFQASPGKLAGYACELAGSDITRAQWQRYVGDRPYRRACPGSR